MDEVRFDRMVPTEVVARRSQCNLAYLPVGCLEWHGSHMPFGTDYFTVTYLAEQAAANFGGVVFPPIYYGDVRYRLQDARPEWRQTYIEQMQVPEAYAAAFGYADVEQPDDGPTPDDPLEFGVEEQIRDFVHFIARTMLSIHLYGFDHIILMPGHGPNPPRCREAEESYLQNILRRTALGKPARTLTYFYIEDAKETEPLLQNHWIHADKWEGSVTMVAAPGTVKLDLLPDDPDELAPAYLGEPYLTETEGYNPEHKDIWYSFDALDPRNDTNEEYGRAQIEAILSKFGAVIDDFIAE